MSMTDEDLRTLYSLAKQVGDMEKLANEALLRRAIAELSRQRRIVAAATDPDFLAAVQVYRGELAATLNHWGYAPCRERDHAEAIDAALAVLDPTMPAVSWRDALANCGEPRATKATAEADRCP